MKQGWVVQHLKTQFREELSARPLFNGFRKVLGMLPKEQKVLYRGLDFQMAHQETQGRGYDDFQSYSVPVGASGILTSALVAMGLNPRHIRTLVLDTEILCRHLAKNGGLSADDWRLRVVRELQELENELTFQKVVAENPGRAVSFDGFGIMIG